jgi:hypothetical protein
LPNVPGRIISPSSIRRHFIQSHKSQDAVTTKSQSNQFYSTAPLINYPTMFLALKFNGNDVEYSPFPGTTTTCSKQTGCTKAVFPRRFIYHVGCALVVMDLDFNNYDCIGRDALTTLCVPSSIVSLSPRCFVDPYYDLVSVVFEYDSQLLSIGMNGFPGSGQLRSFCIPARVTEIDVWDLKHVYYPVFVENGSCSFQICGHFLTDVAGVRLIRSFCRDGEVIIPNSIGILGEYCFANWRDLTAVTFERGSRISRIPKGAFEDCRRLRRICIPSAVEIIDDDAFKNCSNLSKVSFEAESRLVRIGRSAFLSVTASLSIWLPSFVEARCADSFRECESR